MRSTLKCILLLICLSPYALADSYSTTQDFYDWYLKAGRDHRENFSSAKPYFTDELHNMLVKGFASSPDQGWFVDFDPFINAQMDAGKVSVGKPYTVGNNLDMVKVTPIFTRGGTFEGPAVKVYCVKQGSEWKIANIVYPGDPLENVKPWNLKDYLKRGMNILSSGNDPGFVGEDPATMLAIEEVLPGQWLWAGISTEIGGQLLPPPKKTLLNFDTNGQFQQQSDTTFSGTWASGEGHLEWRDQGQPPVTFKVEKFGESEITLRNISTGYYWVLRKL